MNNLAGIYIHIPFCHSKCTYCSFITGSYEEELAQRYHQALLVEIQTKAALLSKDERKVDTIYFGGGTPSIIETKLIAELLQTCYQYFSISETAEITIEMNPADINLAKLSEYRSLGINRTSLGVQSFIDKELIAIGRDHSVAQAHQALNSLRQAGFDNISLDLIAGLPHQSLKQWQQNLKTALELKPEHLSIYLLEIKSGTTLAAQIKSGVLAIPDEDLAAEMYEHLLVEATQQGYQQYEISNFAQVKAGLLTYSHHNIKYWLDLPYYGFGVSAHSYDGQTRSANLKSTTSYIEKMAQTCQAVSETSTLTTLEHAKEAFMLNLRLMVGVDLAAFEQRYQIDMLSKYRSEFNELRDYGLLDLTEQSIKLTPKGILYSNEVFRLFV